MRRGAIALALGYAAYFGAVGVFQPYFPVHLAALGVPPSGIGLLLAVVSALRLVAPLGTAWLADHVEDRRPLIITLALAAVVATAALAVARVPVAIGWALAAFSLTFNGLMPVYDAHALERLGTDAHRYGLLRLWGSLGFVATSAAAGALIDRAGAGSVPVALLALVVLTAAACLALPPARVHHATRPGARAFLAALRRPAMRRLLAIAFLHMTGFGAYYGFYSLYLRAHGYGPTAIGGYWAFGVVAEIAMFACAPRVLARVTLPVLLRVALGATVVRWLVVAALPDSPVPMLLAQALHLAGFALFHTVTVLLGPRLLPPGSGARAQALVGCVGWGAGGVAGSLLAGALWADWGPRSAFVAGALLSLLALGLAFGRLEGAPEAPREGDGEGNRVPGSAACQ